MSSIINATTTAGVTVTGDNSGSLQLATNNGTTAVTIDTSQNVGIGTTGYGSYFSGRKNISLGEGTTINASASGGDPNLTLSSNAFFTSTPDYKYIVSDFASQYEQYNGTHVWQTAPSGTAGNTITFTERMRIASDGGVGINFNPAGNARFVVQADGSAQPMIRLYNSDTGSASQNFISFRRNNVDVGSISGTNTATSYNTSSDYRLKENIAPMTGALAKVAQLKPVTYTWKATGELSQGFIAHELQAVVPDCVTGEKDAVETYTDEDGNEQTRIKPQGVDTSFLVATLTAAIQELKAELDATKAEVQALKGVA